MIDLLLEDGTAFEDPTFFRDVDDAASAVLIELTVLPRNGRREIEGSLSTTMGE